MKASAGFAMAVSFLLLLLHCYVSADDDGEGEPVKNSIYHSRPRNIPSLGKQQHRQEMMKSGRSINAGEVARFPRVFNKFRFRDREQHCQAER